MIKSTRYFGFMASLVVLAGAGATPALAIGDGARAYQLVPDGARVLGAYGIFLDGNASLDPSTAVKNADVSVDVLAMQFTQSVSIGGQVTGLFVVLPVGEVSGTATIERPFRPPVTVNGKSSGLADIQFGGVFGITGSPALALKDYVAFKPGFALGGMVRVTAPTGSYDSANAINLGANRWAFQLGAPMGFIIGDSFLDPSLMTVEMVPSVTFFTANNDPFRANQTTQAPLWRLEAHVTRNINRALWIGVDALGTTGGQAKTDGIENGTAKSSLELGATVGLALSKQFALKATYGGVVARNDSGLDGSGFRLVANLIF
jgi:hypothetical protein